MDIREKFEAEISFNQTFQKVMRALWNSKQMDPAHIALLGADLIERTFGRETTRFIMDENKSRQTFVMRFMQRDNLLIVDEHSTWISLGKRNGQQTVYDSGVRVFDVDQYARIVTEIIVSEPEVDLDDFLAENNLTLNEDK